MEEKSIGLVVGSDGSVYNKAPSKEGMFPRPMAGDPAFSGHDMGSSMANSTRYNDRFRPVDLSVRTGEEFAMAFSPLNSGGWSEIKPGGYWMRGGRNIQIADGEGNQGYAYEGGLMGMGGQMLSGNNISDVAERGNFSSEFGGDYHGVNNENPRATQGFGTGVDDDFRFDDGSVHQLDEAGGFQKVKLMCSFGGKILPRPSDGALRYVGGETRIVTVNRGIGYTELLQKMVEVYGLVVVLKYQLPNEDLDALVSVSCDEDLENMMDEYERLLEGSGEGSSRLRLFLFTASDSDRAHLAAMGDHRYSRQRYVDAVNGITEIGFGKHEDSLASASSQNLENLIGLDSVSNSNLMLPDQGGVSGPLPIKIMPQDVVNSGPLPPSSPVSSKQGTSKVPIPTASTSSSSMLSSVPTYPKQSGLGDSSGLFIPEQQANIASHSYAAFQQLDGGGRYHDTDYRSPVPPVAIFQNDPQIKAAGSRREWQQESFDVSQSMLDTRSDTLLPPLDPHPTVVQHPTPSTYWQHHVDSQLENFRHIQLPNVEGGPAQQPFQQHSLQGAHQNNPWQLIHEGRIYRNAAQEQQHQQQSDLFGGSYSDKPVSAHLQAHKISTAGSLQPVSASQSPHLIGHQNAFGQQHLQMHHPLNVPLMEQPSYGPRLHYYDHSIRALHPMSLPSHYQGQGYEQFVRQQDLRQDHLFHSEEQLIQQHIVSPIHSDSTLQKQVTKPVHAMYEGISISQGHHTNGSVRHPPSNVRENFLQDSAISAGDHQDMTDRRRQIGLLGKEFQPMISRQQGYTITHGGMEYVVQQPSSSYVNERQDEANYVLQHRMQELDFDVASTGRMAKSEAKQEENDTELSGRHLTEPGTTSNGIFLPEDPYGLSASGLSDSRLVYQQSDNFGSFEPTSYQFKQAPTAGDMKSVGILPDPVQATRRTAIMNEVEVPSSGINVQEVRVVNSLQEPTLADQLSSTTSLLSGVDQSIEQRLREVTLSSYVPNTEGEPSISSEMTSMWWTGNIGDDSVKMDMLHIVHKQSLELGEVQLQDGSPLVSKSEISGPGDIPVSAVHNESPSNLICMGEQPQEQLLGEIATGDVSGYLSFMLPDNISNARSSNKSKESISNSEPITLAESLQYGMQVLAKEIVDGDSGNAVMDIQSNRSSLDQVKDGDVTSPAGKSEYELMTDCLKDVSSSNVGTGKVTEPSSCAKTINTSNLSPTSNISVSTSLPVQEEVTYREEVSIQDGFGLGLSSPALPLSDVKVEDKHGEGQRQNVAKDLSAASIQPPLCNSPTLSIHEWDQATKDGNVQGNTSQRELLKGTEDEMITITDSISEDHIAIESGMDKPDIKESTVIQEATDLGLQTIKYADLEELRELGSGTFGTVYHGKWRGTDVAIKRIKNSCFMGKPSEQERLRTDFWREAHMLAQLHHPNVVAFYGVVPDGPGGTLATVTEYMVNGSLKQVLQRKDRYRGIDLRKRLIISMDAAFGMEYLHGKNIVHFDLKCENLLVNMRDPQRPICKVGDLGLSKIKHQTLVSGGVRGTLPWMAPELLNGSSNMVSEKVDVFSFGIVMWELLTGEEPYANMHYGAIIGGIVNNTLRPPIPSTCDPAWRSLMERCWSADPSTRPNFTEITNGLRSMAASLRSKGQGHQAHVQLPPQN